MPSLIRVLLSSVLLTALCGAPQRREQRESQPEPTLPGGKNQQDEILKAEYTKALKEAGDLVELAEQLRTELEKNDRHILSVGSLKKTEEIEKLAKRIRARLRRF